MKTINKNKAFKAKKLATISASKEKQPKQNKIPRPKSYIKTFYQQKILKDGYKLPNMCKLNNQLADQMFPPEPVKIRKVPKVPEMNYENSELNRVRGVLLD